MSTRIVSLTTENVLGVKVAHIQPDPDGNLVVVAGENGQGKSSVLNSIEMALAGADHIPTKPVRRGEESGRVVVDLGDIVVTRTFSANGNSSLVIKNKDDVTQRSPQTLLDSLTGKISFDPLEFVSQRPEEQFETLQKLLGLDFSDKDVEISRITMERRAINRDVDSLKARFTAMPEFPELEGCKEESTAQIMDEQAKAAAANAANDKKRNIATNRKAACARAEEALALQKAQITDLEGRLANAKEALKKRDIEYTDAVNALSAINHEVSALVDVDLAPFKSRAAEAEERNRRIRTNAAKTDLRAQHKTKAEESDKLTRQIQKLEKEKKAAIQGAKWPVAGLGLSDTREVLWNDLPFKQANTAEQIRVSVAVGLAMNAKLRILLIRRGSDLSPKSLKLVAELAAQANAQVWLETSRTDVPASVVMEDGCVQGQSDPSEKAVK